MHDKISVPWPICSDPMWMVKACTNEICNKEKQVGYNTAAVSSECLIYAWYAANGLLT